MKNYKFKRFIAVHKVRLLIDYDYREFVKQQNYELKHGRDYIAAHAYSISHRKALLKGSRCGCFNCLAIFNPNEIKEWIHDRGYTAICPYCGIDSVIGESSGYPITKGFLKKMQMHWFV